MRPVIVPYRPDWATRGTRLCAWLEGLGTPGAVRVDHIGSTAVPGMAAKDVLDVQMSVTDLATSAAFLDERLAGHGFVRQPFEHDHVPAGRDDDPALWAKRVWARRDHREGDVNLHVRRSGSPGERLALLFRDWFRAHDDAVSAYAAFKQAAAAQATDIGRYSDLKDPVVDLVAAVAERWAAATDWRP